MTISRVMHTMRSLGMFPGLFFLALFFLCLVSSPASALLDQPSHIQNVLILNSYHPTFVWTDTQSDGMINGLEKSGLNLSISVEYLDWKQYQDNLTLNNVTNLFQNKYGSHPFDVILVTDDEALDYVIEHRNDIFGNTPVVFTGVNNYALLTPAQLANVTGKTEEISPEKTLSSIFMLFPSTNTINILYENTETGRGIADRIRKAESSYRDRAEFVYITNISFDEMATTVRTFPQGSVIISAFTRDRNGIVMDHPQVMVLLSTHTQVPVFSMWDMAMGHGAIGGSVLSGQHEGEIAGTMAVRILKGEPLSTIPVNTEDTTIYTFDQNQLDRFLVPADRLPAGSTVINRVPGLLDQYFFEVVAAVLAIIILIIYVLVLSFNIQKRKKAEKALAESEKKYRNILESIQDIFYRADRDGNLVMVSPSGAELFGFDTADELIGMNLAGQLYLNPDDRKTFLAALEREGIVRDHEVTLKRRDGTPITISTTSHIYYGPDGTPAGVEGILRDISSRKKAEDALRESERKIRAVFDQTYEFIGLMTPDGILIDANRSALEFAGIPESAVIGKPFWETPWWSHSPELQQKVRNAVAACAQGGFVRFEATHLAPDGSTHYIDFSLKPVWDGEGRVIWLIPEGRDITEHKRAEAALRVSEEKYSKTFQSSPDLILLTSIPEGKILEVNGSILRITGYRQEEVLGRTIDELGFWVDDADREHYKARVRDEGTVLNFPARFRQRSGAIITAWISGSIVSLESGPCFLSVVNDITDWKMAEDALDHARKKLNLLNAIAFTDIQNAIFSLSGYLELEKQFALDDKLNQFLGKQVRIVREISDSLRFANLYQSLGLKSPAWQNVEQSFLFAISHLDISGLSRQINVDRLEIYADPLLENVFFTLAENVLLHGKTVTGYTLRFHESPEGLTLFFEDNGIGIPADMKEKIFDRKFEEKRSMGLFLSREILSITGITIRETGEAGRGARFEILVPRGNYRFTQELLS